MPGPFLRSYKWQDDVIRVLVCDDHALLRRRLLMTLEAEWDIDVLAESADVEHCLALVRDLLPDVVVAGMAIGPAGAPVFAAQVREVCPAARVVMLMTKGDGPRDTPSERASDGASTEQDAIRAVAAGASGFIDGDDLDQAPTIIRGVSAGVAGLPPLVAAQLIDAYDRRTTRIDLDRPGPAPRPPSLTARERAVLEQLALGRSYAVAARTLRLPLFTAKNLAANAIEKLARYARIEGAIPSETDSSPTRL